ncbi:ketoacyl-ACP synthase III [bacterium]|nr:ketoacyl-ACP synthase III [bacterium]
MLNLKINNVSIKGISTVVPKTELCLTDDKTLYDGNEKQLKRVMKSSGFNKRRVTDENTTASDLCYIAGKDLLENMNIPVDTIQGVIFVTQTPDYHIPATACILQDRLGITQASVAFDVNQGCAGYTYGLYIAASLVNSGLKRILLLVGDTSSKYTDMFKEHKSAPIFGDAGSATLLEFDTNAEPIYFDIGTDGSNYDVIMAKNGCFKNPVKKEDFYEDGTYKYKAQMDGMKVMEFTLDKVPKSINIVLDFANTSKEEIDYYIMHQANKFILQNIALNADIPIEKMPFETLSKYGNQSCTSIPSAICDAIRNDIQNRPLKLLLSGFGIGLSWVSCIIDTNKIYCSDIIEY